MNTYLVRFRHIDSSNMYEPSMNIPIEQIGVKSEQIITEEHEIKKLIQQQLSLVIKDVDDIRIESFYQIS